MDEATVRQFRARFTGAEAYTQPVEVKAYGRLVGTWYPAGSVPAPQAPRRPGDGQDVGRQHRPDVPGVPASREPGRPTPVTEAVMGAAERQRQRDDWLRKVSRTGSGSGRVRGAREP